MDLKPVTRIHRMMTVRWNRSVHDDSFGSSAWTDEEAIGAEPRDPFEGPGAQVIRMVVRYQDKVYIGGLVHAKQRGRLTLRKLDEEWIDIDHPPGDLDD